ncbi:MAG: acetyl-CoA acetyltransferase [Pseudomonadota bacterium]
MAKGDVPVLVGVGQVVSHWDGTGNVADAPSPLSLAVAAAKAAIADVDLALSGALAGAIDTLAVNRCWDDSIPKPNYPAGRNSNLPGTIARDLGLNPARSIYWEVGGHAPQEMVNEIAASVHSGDVDCALLVGSEATGATKTARRAGLTLDWTDDDPREVENRWSDDRLLNRTEIKHGLVVPPYFYALIESAIAAREGRGRAAHRRTMAELFAPFSEVAAANPYAQYPKALGVDEIATETARNFMIADPFLRNMIAQDNVNQGAAIIMMSDTKADAIGIAQSQRIYLYGGATAKEGDLSYRQRLDSSRAMQTVLPGALHQASLAATDISVFDLYSCFPCAVTCADDALGGAATASGQPLTVTGGLPYFGGPGNNYSLHAIASMVERLRKRPGAIGLVLANGGWMHKEAAGIYGAARPREFTPPNPVTPLPDMVKIDPDPSSGIVEGWTIVRGRDGSPVGIVSCRTESGARFFANPDEGGLAILREDASPIGRTVSTLREGEVNTARFV